MRLLAPESFVNDPYVAGLNQMGHCVAGGALAAALHAVMPVAAAIAVALVLVLALEGWQWFRLGADLWDLLLDLAFWCAGIFSWMWLVSIGAVTGLATLYPIALIGVAGIVIARFHFLKKEN